VDRRTNRSRGFGFIRFASGSSGSAAVEAAVMDFAVHQLGGKWVEVKPAAPASLLQDFAQRSAEDDMFEGDGCASWLAMATSLAAQADGSQFLQDPDFWGMCCMNGFPGAFANSIMGEESGAAAHRSHARGRRGRRRKQRTSSDFSSATEWMQGAARLADLSISPELSDVEVNSGDEAGRGARTSSFASHSGMTFAESAIMASLPLLDMWGSAACIPGCEGIGSAVDALACQAAVSAGTSPMQVIVPTAELESSGSTEGWPSCSSEATSRGAAGQVRSTTQHLASPLKVACHTERFASSLRSASDPKCNAGEVLQGEERVEGFTREDFLSLQVRPWLAAW